MNILDVHEAGMEKHLNQEETIMETQAGQPSRENIYTEQIGQIINATDEILSHVESIEHKVGIILEPAKSEEVGGSLPDVPAVSLTNLSCHLAELASHIGRLGEHVIRLENRIIV